MAVNPKLILIASELAGNEKVRKTLLYVLFFSLGLIMLIFVVFIGLISGLLSIAQDNDLRNHWNYYRTSISEVFGGIEGEINSDVKSEVYDFMPEFSVNLSKATIANNFDNSSLILYDEKEIRQAQEIIQDYAEKLRKITTEEAFDSFISGYETELSFSDIPQGERTISLDGMVRAALFVYFEGFFDLPVSSSELAPGSNGTLSQCGEVSELHQYTYGTKDMGVPEKGITLALKEKTAVHANLLDCGDCIQDIYVYDI